MNLEEGQSAEPGLGRSRCGQDVDELGAGSRHNPAARRRMHVMGDNDVGGAVQVFRRILESQG